ncbi:unnamed protein product [Prorocentrum cordatum]|uniref:Uncharacterized protein n=1 Tax=Prorocentrum cordatum TaxID=2364126 RepID=A0ABN9W101_9DINO|nr:unnamed protein product [Polarella glacialis]
MRVGICTAVAVGLVVSLLARGLCPFFGRTAQELARAALLRLDYDRLFAGPAVPLGEGRNAPGAATMERLLLGKPRAEPKRLLRVVTWSRGSNKHVRPCSFFICRSARALAPPPRSRLRFRFWFPAGPGLD